ncbi:hypothetical protein [Chryseobacterium sp. StRB126]|uniref:hypothetical protein n=1 Tax=Chryseobacterium sp. StRB126 TaxID=878220 RepID=UPI000AEB52AE|nr:hypothetical protein [Chryseobacterium sp. StRB126]
MEETPQQLHRRTDKSKLTFWKIVGSILVIISGFLPFLDNIIVIFNPAFAGYQNTIGGYLRNDYWLLSLYYTTIIVIIGKFMKAYELLFYFPLFASIYCSSLYVCQFVLGIKFEPEWPHRLGMILMMIPGAYVLYRFVNHLQDLKLEDEIQFRTIERIYKQNNKTNGKD